MRTSLGSLRPATSWTIASTLAALALSCWARPARGGEDRFPFVIPGDDAAPGATDLSGLNAREAGADGFVRAVDGRFATDAGPIRFWGVNTCFGGNFPGADEAAKVAAHLAKCGVNAVRMHHHDNGEAPRGVWGGMRDGRRVFDPAQLDRQDRFLHELHRRGIYANLNLHVSRTFDEREGFVPKSLMPEGMKYDKYILYFEPRMRALFKEFCRDYLLHENPYRKLRRVDDPGIAMVELTNENAFSTQGSWRAAELPEPYRGEFRRQWNVWLRARYRDTAAVRAAWRERVEPAGAELDGGPARGATGLGAWRLHQSKECPVVARWVGEGPRADLPALHLEIGRASREGQHHEFLRPGLTLRKGRLYTLSFWIRAERERRVHVDVSNQGPKSWHSLGFVEQLGVTPEWVEVRRTFAAGEDNERNARICFKFGKDDADLWLAGLRFVEGGELLALPRGQGLERGDVEIPTRAWVEPAQEDARRFMEDVELGFIRELFAYLKKDLGVKVPLTASQITYHGARIVAGTCDYTDIHAYWEHPRFPNRPWDPRDWTIPNTAMERVPGRDALLKCATWRLRDRPFTISEWNIPEPNDHSAGAVPFAATVAALQGWDGVFFFDYHSSERDWFRDRVAGYFSFNGQPVKMALLTACANLYRRGDLGVLGRELCGTLEERLAPELALAARLGIDPKRARMEEAQPPVGGRLATPDGAVVWDASDPARAHLRVTTARTCAVWGLIGGGTFDLGAVNVRVGDVERDYAAIVVTSMDDAPIGKARRLLIAAVGSAANSGMEWNEARTSVSNRWGNAPSQVNGIRATIRVAGCAGGRCHALDGIGRRVGEVPVRAASAGGVEIAIAPEHRTLWYSVE